MAHAIDRSTLPDYERPPVVETILGVQFEKLPTFRNAHLGAFWTTLPHSDWPEAIDAPLLPPQFERFSKAARWGKGMQFRLTDDPACRMQIKNSDGDRMIQLQNNRFHLNWLGEGGGSYPRFPEIRSEFAKYWDQFVRFSDNEKLGEVRANQWEVTYLNHLRKGTVWETPNDWGLFLPLGSTAQLSGIAELEGFSGEWHYVLPDEKGRLHVQWQHGSKTGQGNEDEMIVLTLTARGPVGGDDNDLLSGLDLGREAIVRYFRGAMSDSANAEWGLKNGSH